MKLKNKASLINIKAKTNKSILDKTLDKTRISILLISSICSHIITFAPALADADLRGPIDSNNIDSNTSPNQSSSTFSGTSSTLDSNISSDEVSISRPALSALVSITRTTDPYSLDTDDARPITLDEVARTAIDNNLDIGIGNLNQRSRHALYLASLGKFLPDINLGYNYNYLKGQANLPFIGLSPGGLHFNNPIIITNAGFNLHVFRGGKNLYGALRSKENYRAAQHGQHATVNDALLQSAKLYYDLMLQQAILLARISAVRTSEGQLQLNNDLHTGGLATKLDVYQAETQLSSDRQNLIDQQINRRNAAIELSQYLNIEQGLDLIPANKQMQLVRLVSKRPRPPELLKIAIDNRPELKQYEQLRLAAKRQINLELANLLPTFDFTGNVYGVGETLGPSRTTVTGSEVFVTPGGGAAIAPITLSENRRIGGIWQIGYNIKWSFEGMGMVAAANMHSVKMLARQAQLQQQQVLNRVIAEVRKSYLATLSSENQVAETTSQVESATEELRLAKLRFRYGLGKNIDVLRAQQDYTSALIAKAQALKNFDVAQVQLLRDIGVLSSSTLLSRTPFEG